MPTSMVCGMGEDCVGYHADGQATTFTKDCWCDMTWSLKGQGWYKGGRKGRWVCRRCCDDYGPDCTYEKLKVWNRDYQCRRCTPLAFEAPAANAPKAAGRPPPPPVPPRQVEQHGVTRGSRTEATPRAASPPPPPPPGLPPAVEPKPSPTLLTSASSSAAGGTETGAPSTETPSTSSATIQSSQSCQTEKKTYESRTTSISGEYFATKDVEASVHVFESKFGPFQKQSVSSSG